tara:strand:- start:241 stop:660 length:420 start_codon:yes stop_codon:yes gene_type:complete
MKSDSSAIFNPEIFAGLSTLEVNKLLISVSDSSTKRRRICLHSSKSSTLHLMLIAIGPNHLIPAHSTNTEGSIYYMIHHGSIILECPKKSIHYTLKKEKLIAAKLERTEVRVIKNPNNSPAIYWEITQGPHNPDSTIWK